MGGGYAGGSRRAKRRGRKMNRQVAKFAKYLKKMELGLSGWF